MFGKPRKGIHALRILDVAVVDVLGTVIVAITLSKVLRTNLVLTTVTLFVLGVLFHRLFCVNTKINTLLFGVR